VRDWTAFVASSDDEGELVGGLMEGDLREARRTSRETADMADASLLLNN
jgi:hypothetical protein